jgi:hypothetical protein
MFSSSCAETKVAAFQELVVLRNTVLGWFCAAVAHARYLALVCVPLWHLLIGQVVRTGVVTEAFP